MSFTKKYKQNSQPFEKMATYIVVPQNNENQISNANWLRINDTLNLKPQWLEMNITLKNLVFDIFDVDSLNELEAKVKKEFEKNPNYYFNLPICYDNLLITLALEFTESHLFSPIDTNSDKLTSSDIKFLENILSKHGLKTIFELYTFADYLENEQLVTVLAIHIAQNEISGYTVQELRKKFNIQNDLTPEEEQQIEEQTKWVNEYK